MTIDYKIIGERIRKLRKEKALTQEKLAEMCDLSISYISYIENAKGRNPSLETLVSLSNNLGVTVNTFLKGYQENDLITYNTDYYSLFKDCSCNERQIIYDIAIATKKSLRNVF